jgi:hypothetical protein
MNIPTVEQALAALDANPEAHRAFEKSRAIETPGMSRREAVAKALEALRAKRAAAASAGTASELKARARKAAAELERAAAALRQRKAAAPPSKPAPAKPAAVVAKPAPKAATVTPNRFAGVSDGTLVRVAKEKYFTPEENAAAKAELVRRGITLSPCGKIHSRSLKS